MSNSMLKCRVDLSRSESAGLEKGMSVDDNMKFWTNEAAIVYGGRTSCADLIHIAGMNCRKSRYVYVEIVSVMRFIGSRI